MAFDEYLDRRWLQLISNFHSKCLNIPYLLNTTLICMMMAVVLQTEHARRATQFAYQGYTSASSSAAASMLLGEIYQSMGNFGASLSAFTTAMTVLTQHGLRTRQGGAVMHHIGRCCLQQGEWRRAKNHLNEVLAYKHFHVLVIHGLCHPRTMP